jgi:hypothetical protein
MVEAVVIHAAACSATASVAAKSLGTVLIDATMNLDYDPDPELGGARFPPLVWPAQADIDAAKARWRSSASSRRSGGSAEVGWVDARAGGRKPARISKNLGTNEVSP